MPTITWLFNEQPMRIYPQKTSLVNGTLTIFKMTPDHKGEYRCSAANIWGTSVSHPVKIILLSKSCLILVLPSFLPSFHAF